MSIIPSLAGSFPALSRAAEANRRAVEVFLGEHPELPVARTPASTPGGVAVVTVADVDGLADWLAACGGTIRRTPDDGIATWQLYTSLPPRADGSRVPVRVVTAAAEDVPVADEVLSAVVSAGPRVTAQGPLAPEQLAGIRARVEADYPTVCTGCGHGRLVHAIPAPSPCAVRGWLAPGWRCECPGWQHPYLPVGRHDGRQDRRDAIALLDEVARLGEGLASYRALELGTPDGRVSARCPDPGHPAWLRDLDDTRGCPWCRVAELEKRAAQTRADVLREAVESESEGQVRARALREGAEAVFALDYDDQVKGGEDIGSIREAWDLGTIHAAELLGRLADAAADSTCGHDAQDRCENCRCCHACPGTVCELCSVCWCECRCVPPTSDDRRGDDR